MLRDVFPIGMTTSIRYNQSEFSLFMAIKFQKIVWHAARRLDNGCPTTRDLGIMKSAYNCNWSQGSKHQISCKLLSIVLLFSLDRLSWKSSWLKWSYRMAQTDAIVRRWLLKAFNHHLVKIHLNNFCTKCSDRCWTTWLSVWIGIRTTNNSGIRNMSERELTWVSSGTFLNLKSHLETFSHL